MAEHFTQKEIFQGEEIEAIYRVARRPSAVDPSADLSKADDPMANYVDEDDLPPL